MEDRGFNDVDLRRMLEYASGYTEDIVEGKVRRDGVSCGSGTAMKHRYLDVTFRHGRPIAA